MGNQQGPSGDPHRHRCRASRTCNYLHLTDEEGDVKGRQWASTSSYYNALSPLTSFHSWIEWGHGTEISRLDRARQEEEAVRQKGQLSPWLLQQTGQGKASERTGASAQRPSRNICWSQ